MEKPGRGRRKPDARSHGSRVPRLASRLLPDVRAIRERGPGRGGLDDQRRHQDCHRRSDEEHREFRMHSADGKCRRDLDAGKRQVGKPRPPCGRTLLFRELIGKGERRKPQVESEARARRARGQEAEQEGAVPWRRQPSACEPCGMRAEVSRYSDVRLGAAASTSASCRSR